MCHRDRKAIVPLLAALLFSGCAHIEATKAITATTYVVTSDGHTNRVVIGTNVTFHASGFLANSTLKNIGVDKNTKTTSALLQASGITNEPNPEAIAASAGVVGTILGAALKEALTK